MAWFYLSFSDPDRPKGQQFLGATIIEADNCVFATSKAWKLGLNPGGQVAFVELSDFDPTDKDAQKYVHKFVPREVVMAEPHVKLSELGEWDF